MGRVGERWRLAVGVSVGTGFEEAAEMGTEGERGWLAVALVERAGEALHAQRHDRPRALAFYGKQPRERRGADRCNRRNERIAASWIPFTRSADGTE